MIRLAVFCDGTWNGLQMQNLTNVARLARSIVRDPPGQNGKPGVPQVVYYDEGVGTATGASTHERMASADAPCIIMFFSHSCAAVSPARHTLCTMPFSMRAAFSMRLRAST